MRHRTADSDGSGSAFTDLLFNALLGFAFMFVAAFSLIAEPGARGNTERKAEVLVTVNWPDDYDDDVDVLVEDPRGELVWFRNPDSGLMHLERDDRGNALDRAVLDGTVVGSAINQETVSIRALAAGEYVVNVLHYRAGNDGPVPVNIKVERLNPRLSLIYYGKRTLNGIGDEQTAVRFTVGADGVIAARNELPKALLDRGGR